MQDINEVLTEFQKYLNKFNPSVYSPYELVNRLKFILIKLGDFTTLLRLFVTGITTDILIFIEKNHNNLEVKSLLLEFYKNKIIDLEKQLKKDLVTPVKVEKSKPKAKIFSKVFYRKVKIYLASKLAPLFRIKEKNLILIGEKAGRVATDTGCALFQNIIKRHKGLNVKYVISKKSKDVKKIPKKYRVYYGSLQNFLYAMIAKAIVFNDSQNDIITKGLEFFSTHNKTKKLSLFLQHGVMGIHKMQGYYNYATFSRKIGNVDKMIVSGKAEMEIAHKYLGMPKEKMIVSGLTRFDNYLHNKKFNKQILFMPTWRSYIRESRFSTFESTPYFTAIKSILKNEQIKELLTKYKYNIIFNLHPAAKNLSHHFTQLASYNIKVNVDEIEISDLLQTSAILLTDFSSIMFDFYIKINWLLGTNLIVKIFCVIQAAEYYLRANCRAKLF